MKHDVIHYEREARNYLDLASRNEDRDLDLYLIGRAQVYATLALAAATEASDVPRGICGTSHEIERIGREGPHRTLCDLPAGHIGFHHGEIPHGSVNWGAES